MFLKGVCLLTGAGTGQGSPFRPGARSLPTQSSPAPYYTPCPPLHTHPVLSPYIPWPIPTMSPVLSPTMSPDLYPSSTHPIPQSYQHHPHTHHTPPHPSPAPYPIPRLLGSRNVMSRSVHLLQSRRRTVLLSELFLCFSMEEGS